MPNLNEKINRDLNLRENGLKILDRLKLEFKKIFPQLIAIFIALLVGAIVLLISGFSPIQAYGALIIGAFGDIHGIGQTLTQATPLIFTALAFIPNPRNAADTSSAVVLPIDGTIIFTLLSVKEYSFP